MPAIKYDKLNHSLTLDELRDALTTKDALGKDLAGSAPPEAPDRANSKVTGRHDWRSNKVFETHEGYRRLLGSRRIRPKLARDEAAASKFTTVWQLPGKDVFTAIPELDLVVERAFYLTCGHELTHRLAWKGGWAGMRLALWETNILVPFAAFLVVGGARKLFFIDFRYNIPFVMPDVARLGIWLTIACLATFLLYRFDRRTRPGKPNHADWIGAWRSYAREEVVAEIGACLILSALTGENTWPRYSVHYIARYLSNVEPARRLGVLESSYSQAVLRVSNVRIPPPLETEG